MLKSKLFWPGLAGVLAMATFKWQVYGTILGAPVLIHYGIYLCLFILLLPVADWLVKEVN